MSQQRTAVVFIDALPYRFVGDLDLGAGFEWRPMRSGVGYSLNAKAELFAGLTPDDLGVLNEWSPALEPSRSTLRALSPLDRLPSVSWFVRRLLRKIRGGQISNIPFALHGAFERKGVVAYERSFPFPTVLDDVDSRVLYSEGPAGRDRDRQVWRALQEALESQAHTFFAAFPDLDRSLHENGMTPEVLNDRLAFYSSVLSETSARVDNLVVVSDHGMTTTERLIDVWPAARAAASADGGLFFIDSTMIRVWRPRRPDAWIALAREHNLRILGEDERQRYGLTGEQFGELIMFCPDDAVLSPNFYGRVRGFTSGHLAMHGYHPSSVAQVGVFGGSGPWIGSMLGASSEEMSTLDVHRLLRVLLRRGA